jgi:hypothetical protein
VRSGGRDSEKCRLFTAKEAGVPTWVFIAIAAWVLCVLVVISVLRAAALADRRAERDHEEWLARREAAGEAEPAEEPPPPSPPPRHPGRFARARRPPRTRRPSGDGPRR